MTDDQALEALRIGWKHFDQETINARQAGLSSTEMDAAMSAFTSSVLRLKDAFKDLRRRYEASRGKTATFAEVKPWAR